jgi:hypothetical protein
MSRFPMTLAAIRAYDLWDAQAGAALDALGEDLTDDDVYEWGAEQERQGQVVGHAFWLDTKDFNARDTCESCVRPGEWLRSLVMGGSDGAQAA